MTTPTTTTHRTEVKKLTHRELAEASAIRSIPVVPPEKEVSFFGIIFFHVGFEPDLVPTRGDVVSNPSEKKNGQSNL
jgi:hypothetical protein